MKKIYALVVLCILHQGAFGAATVQDQDEITVLLELIDSTKRHLDEQRGLLKLVMEFKVAREAFISEPTNNRRATQLVKVAMRLHQEMKEQAVATLFSPSFLEEISFFTAVGEKSLLKKIG